MKHFIAFLLEFPVCVVLGVGLKSITGLSNWWCCIPIDVILLLIFIIGYEMTREV